MAGRLVGDGDDAGELGRRLAGTPDEVEARTRQPAEGQYTSAAPLTAALRLMSGCPGDGPRCLARCPGRPGG